MKKINSQKGITLVALIITIIVLLILAVVTIRAVQGDGIIQYAKNARDEYAEKSKEEQKILDRYTDLINGLDSVESLQEKYEFEYYSSLGRAVNDLNNKDNEEYEGEYAPDVNKADAVAGVYQTNGENYVVLLKDFEEKSSIILKKDMTINLGGNTVSFESCIGFKAVKENSNTIKFDGRLEGSKISVSGSGKLAAIQNSAGNSMIIDNVKINVSSEDDLAYAIHSTSSTTSAMSFEISNCEISASTVVNAAAIGIHVGSLCNAQITNCSIDVGASYCYDNGSSKDAVSVYGVFTRANTETTMTKCTVFADGTTGGVSPGVVNCGTMNVIKCDITGTHSGLQTVEGSKTYVTGGKFSSPSHGGMYLSHGGTGEAYIEGAEIAKEAYNGKHDKDAVEATITSGAGCYIGGGDTDTSVYFNNCKFSTNNGVSMILTNNHGYESLNYVYISNSSIQCTKAGRAWSIRIDKAENKLHLGKGNTFEVTENRLTSLKAGVSASDLMAKSIISEPDAEYTRQNN